MVDRVPLWLVQWLMSGTSGVSSRTIARVLAGVPCEAGQLPRDWSKPYDAGDVGRCVALLDLAAQHGEDWRARLHEVGEACAEWAPLVPIWPEIEAAYHRDAAARRAWKDGRRRRSPAQAPFPRSEVQVLIRRAAGEVSDG
jgi:hypothetical protein